MPAPEGTGPGESPGLVASLRAFWGVVIAILYTRLDLVTTELEDEAVRGLKLVLAGLVAVLSFFMAFFFAMYFLIAMFWDTEYRLWMIGGIFAFYVAVGLILYAIVRNMISNRPRFLAQTLAELKRDAEALSRPSPKVESKP